MNEELALRAVLALEAANQASWAELAGVMVGFLQCGLIYYGLRLMEKTGVRRDKQIDQQGKVLEDIATGLREQSASLREVVELSRAQRAEQGEQSAGIRALLERSPTALTDLPCHPTQPPGGRGFGPCRFFCVSFPIPPREGIKKLLFFPPGSAGILPAWFGRWRPRFRLVPRISIPSREGCRVAAGWV